MGGIFTTGTRQGWECYGVGCSGLLPLHCRKLITSSWNLVENFDAQQIFILIFPKISHWKIGVSSVRAVWRPVVPHQSLPCLNIDTYLALSARNFFILVIVVRLTQPLFRCFVTSWRSIYFWFFPWNPKLRQIARIEIRKDFRTR